MHFHGRCIDYFETCAEELFRDCLQIGNLSCMCYYLAARSLYETWACFCYSGHWHPSFLVCFLVCILLFLKGSCLSGVLCHISKITLSSSIPFCGTGASLSQLVWDSPVSAECLADPNEWVVLLCFVSEPSGDLLKSVRVIGCIHVLVCVCASPSVRALFHVHWRYYLLWLLRKHLPILYSSNFASKMHVTLLQKEYPSI